MTEERAEVIGFLLGIPLGVAAVLGFLAVVS